MERRQAGIDDFSAYVEWLLAADLERKEPRATAKKAANEQATDTFAALFHSQRSMSGSFQDLWEPRRDPRFTAVRFDLPSVPGPNPPRHFVTKSE